MRIVTLLLAVSVVLASNAAHFDCSLPKPAREQQTKLVWQFTEFLDAHEAQQLDAKLTRFAQETSNRLLVIVVDTLCGLPPSDLAFEIGEKWGIGNAGFDNGIVFLIKPNGTPGERKIFIATGYGLEAAIPDLRAKQVIEGYVIPNFKAGNYYAGLDQATNALMAMAQGEYSEPSHDPKSFPWPAMVVIGLVIFAVGMSWRNRVKRYSRTNSVDFWTAMWLLNEMDRKHRGRWNGGGGGWSGGGGGGGGFGGFGGGSFGGGGAGGSW